MNRKLSIFTFWVVLAPVFEFGLLQLAHPLFILDLTKLREKFEDDKKKIEQLKTKRKFKPF